MKTSFSPKRKLRGNLILMALIAVSVISLMLGGYLTLVSNQYRTTLRSQHWNSVIATVEAGIEEALTHMNRNCVTNTVNSQPYNFTADGWQQVSGTSKFYKRGDLGASYYIVSVDFTEPTKPVILSEGFVFPALARQAGGPQFAAITTTSDGQNTSTTTTSDGNQTATPNRAPPIARKVRVTTGRDNLIAKAMFAKGNIDLNGKNIGTDSFDSTDPAYSTDGQYDPVKRKDGGDIATNSDLINSLNIGNAKILGNVSTGPGGTVSVGSQGSVGDRAWVDSGTQGIQPGHITDDMNVYVPEVVVPFSVPNASPIRNITLTNPVVKWLFETNTYNTYAAAQEEAAAEGGTIYTNSVIATNSSPPAPGTYLGDLLINTLWSTNATHPASGTYLGGVFTNLESRTSTNYPSVYQGDVATNTAFQTTSNMPAANTYVGNITTNLVSLNSSNYPSGPVVGPVITNTAFTTGTNYPTEYVGTVATNIVTNTVATSSQSYPAEGTYVGSIRTRTVTTGPPSGRGTWYDYNRITGTTTYYAYNRITGYSYQKIASYSYEAIVNYFYQVIKDYTYNAITGYTFNQITDYSLIGREPVTNLVVNHYDYVFDTGNYEVDSLTGKVLVRGDAVVHVTHNLSITGLGFIEVNYGASLKLYVSAESATIAGGGVANYSGDASQFYYYGLPSNTRLSLSGNGGFTGVIYAPQADFTLNGGGNDNHDFVGASVTKSTLMNGNFQFHYDESLARSGPSRGYLITSWNEILD